ncbi:replication protein A 70 kDa DNA-binding subunit A-like [Salvia splendens]|uniref:replication protein A 70 kDa DNA-binding subunit A-like n=1 Tax=Salvia splendens TaxID=180675 RepID=UPI001C26F47A|nr:replication protein A 70 kDa DNA-binding subunit A-like [Salvia splendens]
MGASQETLLLLPPSFMDDGSSPRDPPISTPSPSIFHHQFSHPRVTQIITLAFNLFLTLHYTKEKKRESERETKREPRESKRRKFPPFLSIHHQVQPFLRITYEIMAPFITCVNNLIKAITNSTIKVRCVRAYQGFPEDKDDKSLECVFHDSKGTRIQATFPNNLVQNFGNILREGGIFCIKNFFVRPNTLRNKASNHQFRLLMNVKTEMVEVNDHRFLREMFDFKSFSEVSQYENVDDSSFFDVIGVITGPGRVISQSKYRLIEIEISDENHNKLFCTIWESNVDLYLDQLKKIEGTIPIVIIQFCKRNLFRGEIRISTHFQASKVVINADVKEVKDFRMRIREDSRFVQQVSVIQGGQRVGGEYDDLQLKSLEDLSCLEEGSCWVFGKIDSVECHYGEWYFLACKTCVKKVREVDNKFNCSGCTKTHTYAVKRFKFVVNVVDHTSNASLLLWDREGSQLLGRNVTDFLGNGGQVAPKNSIPSLIEEILVGQKKLPFYCQQSM